ncbi:unnamed protein product [Adineta ricciae]|uniref:C2H2-type domain-containing protein n=1 Tax=Adineta ricciae TaxID=249248 RepID=A0A815AXY0_ADIRI|nr:unnamed protein product [Adineta ricciae]
MFHHISLYHQSEPNFNMTCDLHETCGVLYRTYSAYKSHVYRQHSSELCAKGKLDTNITLIAYDNQQQADMEYSGISTELTSSDSESFDIYDTDPDVSASTNDGDNMKFNNFTTSFGPIDSHSTFAELLAIMKKSYILFLLQLREEYLVPKTVTNVISTYITTFLRHLENIFEKKSFYHSQIDFSHSTSSVPKQDRKIIEFDQLQLTLNDIRVEIESVSKNDYQFVKNCEKYFGYSSAEEIALSSDDEAPEYAYFIPFDKTLKAMLKSPPLALEILENIDQQQLNVANDYDLMFSIRDGSYGIKIDQDSLLVQLYIDDIGLTNPLGSKRDKHKMSMVYFSLEDVPDKYRSKIDFIQLVAVCESKVLKNDVKAQRFFKPIIDNLNQLQLDGLSINDIHLRFSFSTLVADNLASHFIGAFQSCFNGGFFCRKCYITYPQKNLPIPLSEIQTRAIIDHDDLVQKIVSDPNRTPLKGVQGPSPLEDLIGFHATTSLPRDAMHDFIEGVVPMVIMALLKQASSSRLMTYTRVQERMETFKYGRFDCDNQPPPVLAKHFQNNHIVATAAQKLCFFKLFPIMFYDIIDSLPSFIVYKLLREILDLILANPFRKAWLPVLGELCDTFYHEMLNHFPGMITPKVHFIREYHQMVADFGPAIRQWCFRYEGFHAYFKKIANRTNNFKNIPKMLVTRYRLKQCLTFGYAPELRRSQHVIGIKKIRSTCFNLAMRNLLVKHFDQIDFENIFQCNALVYENIEYRRSCVYVVDLQPSHEQPSFAQIVFIVKMKEKWWLLVDMLDTMSYNEKLFSWQIQSMDHYSIIDPRELKYYYKGLDVYVVNDLSFVSFVSRLTWH